MGVTTYVIDQRIQLVEVVAHDRVDQGDPILEVPIQCGPANACGDADFLQRHIKALLGEGEFRRRKNALAPYGCIATLNPFLQEPSAS